jgi:hypothetical protein
MSAQFNARREKQGKWTCTIGLYSGHLPPKETDCWLKHQKPLFKSRRRSIVGLRCAKCC